jgi:hypothetical protein
VRWDCDFATKKCILNQIAENISFKILRFVNIEKIAFQIAGK